MLFNLQVNDDRDASVAARDAFWVHEAEQLRTRVQQLEAELSASSALILQGGQAASEAAQEDSGCSGGEVLELRGKVSELTRLLEANTAKATALKQEVADAEAEAGVLRNQLRAAEEDGCRAAAEAEARLRERLDAAQREYEEVAERLAQQWVIDAESASAAASQLQLQVDHLGRQLAEAQRETAEAEGRANAATAATAALQLSEAQREELAARQRDGAEEQASVLRAELAASEERAAALEQELAARQRDGAEEQASVLRAELAASEERAVALEQELAARQRDGAQLRQHVEELGRSLAVAMEEATLAAAEGAKAGHRTEITTGEPAGVGKQWTEGGAQLAGLEAELAGLRAELAVAVAELEAERQAREEVEGQLQTVMSQV